MEIYDVITVVVWVVLVFGFGALLGVFTSAIATDKMRNCIIIVAYVALIMILADWSIMEVVMDILDMAISELAILCIWPIIAMVGSRIGKEYKIVIERR